MSFLSAVGLPVSACDKGRDMCRIRGGGGGTFQSPCLPHCPAPHTLEKPAKESQGSPRTKRTAMKWDLRWLLGSLRVFLSVKGNKGKDNDVGGGERMAEVTENAQMR